MDLEVIRKKLKTIASKLPPGATAFALANWHYDFSHHQCPHDAWLDSLRIEEVATGDRHQFRSLRATMTLLGAYQDGRIQLSYDDVVCYTLEKQAAGRSHGDWLHDEVQLTTEGLVAHEIVFTSGRMRIECHDFSYSWIPLE